jgi:hypothetical protein
MSVTAKPIDQRLRERADSKTHNELNALFVQIESLINNDPSVTVDALYPDGGKKGERMYLRCAARALQQGLFLALRDRRRENEISDFIQAVERLQGEVSDLRNSVVDHA